MGDLNQVEYLKRNAHLVRGPILEIGSKDYGNTPDYRSIFSGKQYVGVDLEEGKGVDAVIDVSSDYETMISKLEIRKFNTIICFSVLEHCRDLYKICQNIQRLLDDGGQLFVSVPFSWEYHKFPEDYWRFTPAGIKVLFSDLKFDDDLARMSTSRLGEMKRIDGEFYKIDMAPSVGIRKKRYGWCAGVGIKMLKSIPFFKPILDYVFLMPPVAVHMVGIKRVSGSGVVKDA